jgi:hypothetical protein
MSFDVHMPSKGQVWLGGMTRMLDLQFGRPIKI